MKKIKLTIELEYDDKLIYGEDDKVGREWFFKEILFEDNLELWSEEISDYIGHVKCLNIISTVKKFLKGE